MKTQCILAVEAALGRKLVAKEAADIEARVKVAMVWRARKDPAAWHSMTQADRLLLGAQDAGKALVAEARVKRDQIASNIMIKSRIDTLANGRPPGDEFGHLDAILDHRPDNTGGTVSIASSAHAVTLDAIGRIGDVMKASRKWFGLLFDEQGSRDIIRELFGEDSGNALAKKAAQAFKMVAEEMRLRFNRAGGNVGALERWALPQSHVTERVGRNFDAWVSDHVAWADRAMYVHPDGVRYTDAELADFFTAAAHNISSDGLINLEPGKNVGSSALANRGSESRQIHYRDAAAWIEAQAKYGEKNLLDIMVGHLQSMGRDIALVEGLGTNPSRMIKLALDEATVRAAAGGKTPSEINATRRHIEHLFNEVAGGDRQPVSPFWANLLSGARSLNVAAKLGSSFITSVVDYANIFSTARFNRLPLADVIRNELKYYVSREFRDQVQSAGIATNQMIGALNRWGRDGLGTSGEVAGKWARGNAKLAQFVMQASLLNAVTSGRQAGTAVTFMHRFGKLTRTAETLGHLDARDRALVEGAGIRDLTWAIWRKAQPEDWGGINKEILTSRAIRAIPDADLAALVGSTDSDAIARARDMAATQLMAVVGDETRMAVIEPSARVRARMSFGYDRSTTKGQVITSILQFKSFSIANAMSHIQRGAVQPGWGKALYLAPWAVGSTFLGAIAIQLNEIASGRDPRNMEDPLFWPAAAMKGGALGVYGDFILADATQYGHSFLGTLGGPIGGDIEGIYDLIIANAHELARGEDTHAGAELLKFAKGHAPGANIWYTKAITDHLILHSLQEAASPGYLRKMQRRAERDYGQHFYWSPGLHPPERAPYLPAAWGEEAP